MQTLPLANLKWPLFRILVRASWAGTVTANSSWEALAMQKRDLANPGYYLKFVERCCLPMIGTARFAFRFGNFQSVFTGGQPSTSGRWDPDTDNLSLRDLTGYEIRIQAAPRPVDDPATGDTDESASVEWQTIWLGYVDYQEDVGWPGALIPAGERVYHCVETIARTSRWRMDRHGYTNNGANFANVRGHPGYNVGNRRSSQAAGNKHATLTYLVEGGIEVPYHTQPGAGDRWTDAEAVNHALSASRPPGEPHFVVSDIASLLTGTTAWEVKEGETVLDFLVRVLKRERGRGVAFVGWTEASADGPITISFNVYPQLWQSLTYKDPVSGLDVDLYGAAAALTAINVDLIGDHRVDAQSFQLGSPDQWKYDYLESFGEPIEVLATLAYQDGFVSSSGRSVSLERRWGSAEQSTFEALSPALKRAEDRYRPVYQLHGLPRDWKGLAGDGNNTGTVRVDYRTDDAGAIVVPTGASDTSPLLVEVLPDLPIFVGYSYEAATPARADAQTETGDPQRRRPLILIRLASELFLESEHTTKPATMQIDDDGIWVYVPSDTSESGGFRYISKTSVSIGAKYNMQALALTVGLRMPHRVRMASYAAGKTEADAKRRLTVYHPNIHLWLASPGAIWDLNMTTGTVSTGFAPRRVAAGVAGVPTPRLLRDDRSALARLHYLAWAWYLNTRRTVSWTLRDCGFLPTYDTESDGAQTYPGLGFVVHRMLANGENHTIDTPIVRIAYDNENGTTTWETGWQSLDFSA